MRIERFGRVTLLKRVEHTLFARLQLFGSRLKQVVQRGLRHDASARDKRARDALREPLLEIDEVQLPRRSHERKDAGGIVLARNGDRNTVALLELDLRLRNTDCVDARAQDLHSRVHLLFRDRLTLFRLRFERNLGTALKVEPQDRCP